MGMGGGAPQIPPQIGGPPTMGAQIDPQQLQQLMQQIQQMRGGAAPGVGAPGAMGGGMPGTMGMQQPGGMNPQLQQLLMQFRQNPGLMGQMGGGGGTP
jgi:hypothetical protein